MSIMPLVVFSECREAYFFIVVPLFFQKIAHCCVSAYACHYVHCGGEVAKPLPLPAGYYYRQVCLFCDTHISTIAVVIIFPDVNPALNHPLWCSAELPWRHYRVSP